MKVKAHLVVSKGYHLAITASQWVDEVLEHCEEYNKEHHGEGYLTKPKERAVVTVEFEVPDNVFNPLPPPPVIQGKVVDKK